MKALTRQTGKKLLGFASLLYLLIYIFLYRENFLNGMQSAITDLLLLF